MDVKSIKTIKQKSSKHGLKPFKVLLKIKGGGRIVLKFKKNMGGHLYQEKIWNDFSRFIISEAGRRGGKTRANGAKASQLIYLDLAKLYKLESELKQARNVSYKNEQEYKVRVKELTEKIGSIKQTNSPDVDTDEPRLLYWFVAPTYGLTKAMKKAFLQYIPKNLIQKHDKSKNRLWLYPEICIEFKSADKPDSLVSEGLNGLWMTETARIKRNAWNDNLRPCLSDYMGWMLSDTTPMGHNWYVEEIANYADQNNERYDSDYSFYYWKTIDNTKLPGIVEEVEKAKKTMPLKYFLRNYEASRDAFFGQIYEEFNKAIHVQDFKFNPDRYKYIVGGQDWGYTHHGALIIVGITHDDGADILEEFAYQKTPVTKPFEEYHGRTWVGIAKDAQEKYNLEMIYCGPDQPEHIEMYRQNGIRATKADNSVSEGIQFVCSIMVVDENRHTNYRIHKDCKLLIQNKTTQRWKENKEGNESEQPEKTNDDANDAERYAIFSARRLFKKQYIEKAEYEKEN